ncbi:unnamed protein product [Protopolystoma xenopodis]|uniref:Uncharacterized protein n=1 Tax=Protopolystoma xenopodis TaxID=117903 RepID=A0A448XB60_9PLAT|nr:unnamed protein product [Protopolystoma xenopodis]
MCKLDILHAYGLRPDLGPSFSAPLSSTSNNLASSNLLSGSPPDILVSTTSPDSIGVRRLILSPNALASQSCAAVTNANDCSPGGGSNASSTTLTTGADNHTVVSGQVPATGSITCVNPLFGIQGLEMYHCHSVSYHHRHRAYQHQHLHHHYHGTHHSRSGLLSLPHPAISDPLNEQNSCTIDPSGMSLAISAAATNVSAGSNSTTLSGGPGLFVECPRCTKPPPSPCICSCPCFPDGPTSSASVISPSLTELALHQRYLPSSSSNCGGRCCEIAVDDSSPSFTQPATQQRSVTSPYSVCRRLPVCCHCSSNQSLEASVSDPHGRASNGLGLTTDAGAWPMLTHRPSRKNLNQITGLGCGIDEIKMAERIKIAEVEDEKKGNESFTSTELEDSDAKVMETKDEVVGEKHKRVIVRRGWHDGCSTKLKDCLLRQPNCRPPASVPLTDTELHVRMPHIVITNYTGHE